MPRARYENPPPELLRLGRSIRDLRERKGLKQIEVATAAEVSESQISDIERGKNNPGWLLLIRVVEEGLGSSIGEFAELYRQPHEA